jgi:hypothetical protein
MRRFKNEISNESLAKVRRLIAATRQIQTGTSSQALFDKARIDRHTGIGVLAALDVEGIVHAVAGPRRTLQWRPGPRPEGEEPPKIIERKRYARLMWLLKTCSAVFITTDVLMIGAYFVESQRRQLRGALKAEVVLGNVAWRNFTNPDADYESPAAIEWRWIGRGGRGHPFLAEIFGIAHAVSLDKPVRNSDGEVIGGASILDRIRYEDAMSGPDWRDE